MHQRHLSVTALAFEGATIAIGFICKAAGILLAALLEQTDHGKNSLIAKLSLTKGLCYI